MGTIRFLVLVCGIPVHRVISPTGPNLLLVFSLSLSLSLSSALTVDIQHLPCYFPRRYFLMGLLLDGFVWQFSFRFWADILLSQFSSSHRMDRKLGFQSSTFRGILLHLLLLSAARRSLPNSGFPRPLFLSLPQLPQIGDRSGELGPASSPSCAV
ncbi:hypothetical protein BDL97_05G018300 [Sphagnum fallax]|nr:hypothetical protein BDL97_05G018300 [Sphagnum fallax]